MSVAELAAVAAADNVKEDTDEAELDSEGAASLEKEASVINAASV